jgi:pimeloyl-ACP methyl ester carboxylesterase
LPGTPRAARSSPRSAPTRPTSSAWSTCRVRAGRGRVDRRQGGALLSQGPPGAALAHLDVDQGSFAWLPEDDFVNHFAADVDPVKAKVMSAVQQPLHWSALEEVMGVPAWKSLPSWFLVAEGDQAIPPDAQRQFAARMGATTVEVSTNHVAMVSHPEEVLQLIKTAVEAMPVAT